MIIIFVLPKIISVTIFYTVNLDEDYETDLLVVVVAVLIIFKHLSQIKHDKKAP